MRILKKLLPIGMFLLSTLCLVSCESSGTTLYPIQNTDIQFIHKGEVAQVDGYILTEFYMNEVMQAKIKEHK